MIIDRKPHKTAHRFSSSPGLKANGKVAAGHAGKTPEVADRIDLSRASPRRTYTYLALTGLALAGAVTAHATNVIPSATIADLTGSERLENLRFLDQHGTLKQGSPEAAYRDMGVRIGELHYYNHTVLKMDGSDSSLRLNNHRQVAELAAHLRGDFNWGLTQEEMAMATELSQLPGFGRSSYGDTLDRHGIGLARGLEGRGISVQLERESYHLNSAEDLRTMHEFFFGDRFTPEPQRQLTAVRMLTGYNKNNLLEVFDSFEAGESVSFATLFDGVVYEAEVFNLEQLFEFGQRILNSRENASYQPFPHELAGAARTTLPPIATDLELARAQYEAVRGMAGVGQVTLSDRLERVELATRQLEELQERIYAWTGGDAAELRQTAQLLQRSLESLNNSSVSWDPIGPQRAQRLSAHLDSLAALIRLTAKPQAPEGFRDLPSVKEHYQTSRNEWGARPKISTRADQLDAR